MKKESKPVISVRIPIDLLDKVDVWRQENGGVSRTMAIVYLLAQQLVKERKE